MAEIRRSARNPIALQARIKQFLGLFPVPAAMLGYASVNCGKHWRRKNGHTDALVRNVCDKQGE